MFLSMTTSQLLIQGHIQPTLFAVDSHAKTSPMLASKPASRKALGLVSFTNSCESFAWYSPDTLSWKTSQRSLLTDWTPFLGSWPRQGLMRNGRAFQRVLWAPAIKEIGGGLLRTPTVGMVNQDRSQDPQYMSKLLAKGQTVTLAAQMKSAEMLPTPRTCSAMASRLDTAGNLERDRFPNLETVMARMLPTQVARDWKGVGRADQLPTVLTPTGAATYLNPSFVEEMMGFPIGWTV
jgi:hypothetical protein